MKRLFWLLLFNALNILGLLFFLNGFLLKRCAIDSRSSKIFEVKNNEQISPIDLILKKQSLKEFNKTIILLIDALRYDFCEFKQKPVSEHFENKLPVIHDLIQTYPLHSRLYKFIADPPTTTLQRLKALTTGSLPTFVDAGSNFAGTAVVEDNFVDQAINAGLNVTFAGDDTWNSLYPTQFLRKFPFPSLNVKDLHTVDNGILEHLIPELQKPDWQILIAHFLGVDHCGHRYGPNHPEMASKLTLMNDMILNVTGEMDSDTILFLFGDHGMTSTGDHGGDSTNELEAALFVYSPKQITTNPDLTPKSISQVDLVPTLSLLLGLPIPFSNLGQPIDDLLSLDHKQLPIALYRNAKQMHRYLSAYSVACSDLPAAEFNGSFALFQSAEHLISISDQFSEQFSHELTERLKLFLERSRQMCRKVWAKFDFHSIGVGIFILACGLLLSACHGYYELTTLFAALCAVILIPVIVISHLLKGFHLVFSVCLLTVGLLMLCALIFTSTPRKTSKNRYCALDCASTFLIMVVFVIQVGSLASNSYVVAENWSLLFLGATTVLILMLNIIFKFSRLDGQSAKQFTGKKKTRPTKFDIGFLFSERRFRIILWSCSILICLRAATLFFSCREEQKTCEETLFSVSLSSMESNLYKNIRFSIGILALFFVLLVVILPLKASGNLNSRSPAVVVTKVFLPIIAVLISLYWALTSFVKFDTLPDWQANTLPRLIYLLLLIGFLSLLYDPFMVLTIQPKAALLDYVRTSANPVQNIFNLLKNDTDLNYYPKVHHSANNSFSSQDPNLIASDSKLSDKPIAYGLGTVYSAPVYLFSALCCLLCSLLLGNGFALSILFLLVVYLILVEVITVGMRLSALLNCDGGILSYSSVTVWFLIGQLFFYGTGHQPIITAIKWDAAFIGLSGDFTSYVIPAFLIAVNTFAAEIISVTLLPLLVLRPYSADPILGLPGNSEGEFSLTEQENFQSELFSVFHKYSLLHHIKSYLKQFGYLSESTPNSLNAGGVAQMLKLPQVNSAILAFQDMMHLPKTGRLDSLTLNMMMKPRCGNRDIEPQRTKRQAAKRKWSKNVLTYRISQYLTNGSPTKEETDVEIGKAFQMWSQYIPMDFVKVTDSSKTVDIDIKFAAFRHGDSWPFDGRGKTLAHAFFPPHGDIHFDASEKWSLHFRRGTRLQEVAAHECGHSLGLPHSRDKKSLMAPTYKGLPNDELRLFADDISRIQRTYGVRQPSLPPFVPRTLDLCAQSKFDAISILADLSTGGSISLNTYIFKSIFMWKLTASGIASGSPQLISSRFPEITGPLDAAVHAFWRQDRATYMFKGSQYWRVGPRGIHPGYPKQISIGWVGVPDNVDAAFTWSGNGQVYFIKDDQYYRSGITNGYPRPLTRWNGLPNRVDMAFQFSNRRTYFFKDDQYYRFNDRQVRVDNPSIPPYPRLTKRWWLRCPGSFIDLLVRNHSTPSNLSGRGNPSFSGSQRYRRNRFSELEHDFVFLSKATPSFSSVFYQCCFVCLCFFAQFLY